MNYTIFLGPTNQAVPDELWDEFRERELLFSWELVFRSYGGDTMNAYRVLLEPGFRSRGAEAASY